VTAPLQGMNDRELGAAIAQLSEEIAWPQAPRSAAAAVATIRERRARPSLPPPRLSLPSRRRTVVVILAALLALAATALAARLVIHLGAVTVRVVEDAPTAPPTGVATGEEFGREVSIADASRIAGFVPALPASLGPPASTWVDETETGLEPGDRTTRIVNAWAPRPGLPPVEGTGSGAVLMQFHGEWEVASKLLSAETNRFGEAIVEGRVAFWTTGEHELVLVTGDQNRRVLVTGNVLIWQDAGSTFRLETALPKERAVAIADSVDPIVELG
jgi:hypothetical protein